MAAAETDNVALELAHAAGFDAVDVVRCLWPHALQLIEVTGMSDALSQRAPLDIPGERALETLGIKAAWSELRNAVQLSCVPFTSVRRAHMTIRAFEVRHFVALAHVWCFTPTNSFPPTHQSLLPSRDHRRLGRSLAVRIAACCQKCVPSLQCYLQCQLGQLARSCSRDSCSKDQCRRARSPSTLLTCVTGASIRSGSDVPARTVAMASGESEVNDSTKSPSTKPAAGVVRCSLFQALHLRYRG